MEITKDHKEQIEQIIKELECPRRYECYRSEFEELPLLKQAGLANWWNALYAMPDSALSSSPLALVCVARALFATTLSGTSINNQNQ